MTARPGLDRSITEWLMAEVPDRAPDRVLEASRARIRTTQQRRAWWPAWRVPLMNNIVRVVAAVGAVAVAALLGYQLLFAPNVGGPITPQGPTLSPSAAPSPVGDLESFTGTDALAPGAYAIDNVGRFTITLTVPAGWAKHTVPAVVWAADDSGRLSFSTVDNLFADPCAADPVLLDPPLGPTVDDLVRALADVPGLTVGPATEVSVAGHVGTRMELTVDESCADATLWWIQPLNDAGPVEGRVTLWIVDVEGERLVIAAHQGSSARIDEMHAMVDSLDIEP